MNTCEMESRSPGMAGRSWLVIQVAYGETDEFGAKAVVDAVHMHDLHATLLHLLGMDHEQLTYRFDGRNFRLTDVHGSVVRKILA